MWARFSVYGLPGVVAVVVISLAPKDSQGTVSAAVLVVATIALAAVAIEAVHYSRELVSTTRAPVDAANASTREARRQALFAGTPLVRIDRPELGNGPVDQGLS
jgi:hypothetical protein